MYIAWLKLPSVEILGELFFIEDREAFGGWPGLRIAPFIKAINQPDLIQLTAMRGQINDIIVFQNAQGLV